MLLAILRFNYNVVYVKRKKAHFHTERQNWCVTHITMFWEGLMFEDRKIIPKCFNGLDSETIHLYNVNKEKFD